MRTRSSDMNYRPCDSGCSDQPRPGRITQPVLAVVGEHSDPRFHQRQELLLDWLPVVEPFMLSNAGHLLHLDNGRDMAQGLADFFARHSIGKPAS